MRPRYFMLSGVGRSGTTVLRKALGCHPDVYYNGMENNIVQDVLACALRNCTMDSRKYSMVVSREQYNRLFRRLMTDILWPDENRRGTRTLMCAINLTADLADYLFEVFPDCRMVYLIRNGIEVVASRQRFTGFASATFAEQCDVWLRSQAMWNWGRSHPEVFREFRHEWMIDETELRLKFNELFAWLGFGPNDVCANHVLANRYHATGEAANTVIADLDYTQVDAAGRQMMTDQRRDRWKSWDPGQRKTFEEKCGAFMNDLGYPLPWRTGTP